MLKLTKRAATRILKAAEQGNMTGLALRLAPLIKADGSLEYNKMGFDEIKKNDIHIHCEGVDIVFEPSYKDLLDGAVMDFIEIEKDNFTYVFLNPNEPHYVPPTEE